MKQGNAWKAPALSGVPTPPTLSFFFCPLPSQLEMFSLPFSVVQVLQLKPHLLHEARPVCSDCTHTQQDSQVMTEARHWTMCCEGFASNGLQMLPSCSIRFGHFASVVSFLDQNVPCIGTQALATDRTHPPWVLPPAVRSTIYCGFSHALWRSKGSQEGCRGTHTPEAGKLLFL